MIELVYCVIDISLDLIFEMASVAERKYNLSSNIKEI